MNIKKQYFNNKSKMNIISLFKESKFIFDQNIDNISGEYNVIPGILGIPVVGSLNIDSIRKCFPYTAIDVLNNKKVSTIINKINSDKSFFNLIVKTAKEKSEEYSFKNSKYNFLKKIYLETNNEKFLI